MAFQCTLCPRKFVMKVNLRHHTNNIHLGLLKGNLNYECVFCRKKFYQRQQFYGHIRSHIQERPFFCPVCDAEVRTENGFRIHLKTHDQNRKRTVSCQLCPKMFFRECERRKHLLSHTLEKPHKCPKCSKSFPYQGILNSHLETTHSENRPYECTLPGCGKRFKKVSQLERHISHVHKAEKKMSCKICGKRFPDNSHLKLHILTHTGETPYQCLGCKRRFNCPGNLARHKRAKGGCKLYLSKKPHSCKICSKSFGSVYPLRNHMKTHAKGYQRPRLPCPVCGHVYRSSGGLLRHQKKAHPS